MSWYDRKSEDYTETESLSRSICLLTRSGNASTARNKARVFKTHSTHKPTYRRVWLFEFNKTTGTKFSPILLTLPDASVTDLSPTDIPFLQLTVQPTRDKRTSHFLRNLPCDYEGDGSGVSLVNSVRTNLAIFQVSHKGG